MKVYKVIFALLLTAGLSYVSWGQKKNSVKTALKNGKAIFEQNCLTCHQADGSGVPNLAPPLIQTDYVLGEKPRLVKVVLNGLSGVEIQGETYSNPMPSFDMLSDQQIADVLTYIRNSFGNKADQVKAEEVKEIRANNKQ